LSYPARFAVSRERTIATPLLPSLQRAAAWLWWLLDASRRALLNLLFLLLVLALLWLALRNGPQPLQDKTALVLALRGPLHEQYSGSLRDNALKQAQGQPLAQTRLRDVLVALDAAARDPAIARTVLILDDFAGAGLPTLREVAAALERFKAGGKPVIAWGSAYDQRQYYLAAHATEVWMHPMGSVQIEGFGGYRNYYKDALDRVGVTAHVLRVGQYKNAGESFTANEPSAQTLEADSLLYDAMWASYTSGVERARKLAPGSVTASLDDLPQRLAAVGGDMAKLAVKDKFVDALKTRDQLRNSLIEQGARDGSTFRQIAFEAYLGRVKPATGSDAVGIVIAEGSISDGQAGGGGIGGLSTSEMIRQAREDDHIKALVLRVDSPGGSAFGSELVRRELELTRQAGKPVVVSMGDVAASGGYWISTASDEVIADETTITGSIGVVAVLPTAEGAMDKLSLHTGGHTTSWLVGAYDLRRGLDPRLEKVIQASIDHVYADFTARVAAARKTTPDAINAVGQGRVWTGAQAKERGLVDRLGSFGDAIAAAAQRGRLADGYRVVYIEQQPGRTERLLALFGSQVAAALGADFDTTALLPGWWPAVPPAALRQVQADLSWLAALGEPGPGRRPFAAMTHCLCSAP
jgi:protease-4